MFKSLAWFVAAVLFFACDLGQGLECYHCFSGKAAQGGKDGSFVPCNEANLTASNTWVCPSNKARCVYEEVEIQSTKAVQTWRVCSNGILDPCDPKNLPPGFRMIKCSHCGTDRCNLHFEGKPDESLTFNINANINLYIRQ